MSENKVFIEAYFKDQLEPDLARAQELLADRYHYLDAILLLSCHIGSYGAIRYPDLSDNRAYKTVVLEYSGMREFYERVDLLFFCQWSRSEFKHNKTYKKLNNYDEIRDLILARYGDEQTIKADTDNRYITPEGFADHIDANSFKGYDPQNLREYLPLFSNVELLYRYLRCHAVHSQSFPLVNIGRNEDGAICYQDNHAITGEVLNDTASRILANLKEQCIASEKWPAEL